MAESLVFDTSYSYNTGKSGIAVPVVLRANGRAIEFEAKIDTGAENCIFERWYGEMLGLIIELGEEEIFSTAEGIFAAYKHEVTLSVLGIEIVSTVYFAKDEFFTRNVLGRKGWLDRMKLGLIDDEGKLLLSEYHK